MRFLTIILLLLSISPAWATPKAPLSSGQPVNITGTISTSPVVVLLQDLARGFLIIQNTTQGTNGLACTVDGSTPSIGGKGVQLAGIASGAGGTAFFDAFVPLGAITCIGSGSGTVYSITYLP